MEKKSYKLKGVYPIKSHLGGAEISLNNDVYARSTNMPNVSDCSVKKDQIKKGTLSGKGKVYRDEEGNLIVKDFTPDSISMDPRNVE